MDGPSQGPEMYHIEGEWRIRPRRSTSVQPAEFVFSRLDPGFSYEQAFEVLSRLADSSFLGAHATVVPILGQSDVMSLPGTSYFEEGLMKRCQNQKCQIFVPITICLQFHSFEFQRLKTFTINTLFVWPA